MEEVVITASPGPTAFIVFATAKSLAAQERNVIGGHLAGLGCGAVCALISHSTAPYEVLVYCAALGLSIFIMVVTDTDHPPASGTALGVVRQGISAGVIVAVITGALLLSLAHHFGKGKLRDLA